MDQRPSAGIGTGTATPQGAATHDPRTIRLHWWTAALVAALWIIAQLIDDFPRGLPRISARSTHIVLGVVLVLVVARRIGWRALHGRRLEVPGPRWLGAAAGAVHLLLYAGLVAVLLLGITNAWVRGDNLFGLVAIPKLLPGHAQLRPAIESLHKILANALVILAVLHALAALFHHFHLKDDVLRRMLPRQAPRTRVR
jgi:cytochrome b561